MIETRAGITGLWLTDFDGTIKPEGEGGVSPADRESLKKMKDLGWLRVIVTGRSLFGFVKAWEPGLELDALIFSSGAGVCRWDAMGPGPLTFSRTFEEAEARRALAAARAMKYGFFAFQQPPDNHHFYYHRPEIVPAGFERRLEIFSVQNHKWSDALLQNENPPVISQLLLMVPAEDIVEAETEFNLLAPGFSLVRSTSPFGDGCLWLEIYPPGVDKGRAAARLAASLSLEPGQCVALGNDYNDCSMLDWAGRSFISAEAPPELTGRYQVMPPAGCGGLAWALGTVLGENEVEGNKP